LNFVVEVRRLLAVVLAAVLFTSYQKYPEEHGVIQQVTLWLGELSVQTLDARPCSVRVLL